MISAALKTLLECRVCFQVPRNKILICTNSHKICETCYDKITAGAKQCPQGNCPYDEPPRRNRELEAIVDNIDLELSCSKASAGCTVEMKKEALKKHEIECIYRQVPCPATICQKRILFNSIDSHISESHKNINKKQSPGRNPRFKDEDLDIENHNWILCEWKNENGDVFTHNF